jgi:predicted metalloprotease
MFGLIFNENNLNYKKPNIVLFIGGVETACGNASFRSFLLSCRSKGIYGFAFLKN